ncbi:MAG: hypothetical protein QN152_05360 [Armatimonadota bacterium]|nr:hypothetical protein [Armatimonadota bacterium]MDR7426683.1 hypothetical protein [Armatimonadota bacterium]MDR7464918.1 hypothetical protein [Armatimonadota bacterium]MDR7469234.1 hypothetical protein [Armatimonadota bacterium]MDR7475055.1 hypothetical protein [Armatimonadota bacterium]
MRRYRWWIAASALVALLALAGGAYYLARSRLAPARPADPGLAIVLAIRILERDPATRLTREQAVAILPLLRALQEVPPGDAEAAAAFARAVRDRFTPEQRAALRAVRQRGGAGPGGTAGPGPGLPGAPRRLGPEQRAQLRGRLLQETIRALEERAR